MNKIVFFVIIVLLAVSAVAIYGNIRGSQSETVSLIQPADKQPDNGSYNEKAALTDYEKVNVETLSKAGVCADLESAKTEGECKAGTTEEELVIDDNTSVIFQSVCETGLNETEKGLLGEEYPYSVRKTLAVFLEDKKDQSRETIDRICINYVPEKYVPDGKPDCYDAPYILDAAVSDDGNLLRFLVKFDLGYVCVYQYDLQKIGGVENYNNSVTIYEDLPPLRIGKLKQAYFVLPDTINLISESGCEYSVKIAYNDSWNDQAAKSGRKSNKKLLQDCVYWNKKGSRVYFYTYAREIQGSATGAKTAAGFSLPDTPPVPTDRDWEGWHKLVRNP